MTIPAGARIACRPYGARAYDSFTFRRTSDPSAKPTGGAGEAEICCG